MDTDRPTTSLWMATHEIESKQSLREDTTCDVAIIGAGIAGLSVAYMLCKQGKNVIVVDDGIIAGGQTQRTTAHISNLLDRRYKELETLHGGQKAKLIYESLSAARDQIASIIEEENIACDYEIVRGYLCLGRGQDVKELEDELEAMEKAGFSQVSLIKNPAIFKAETSCLSIPGQAQFHILRYLSALVAAIERMGGRIFCNTHIDQIVDGLPVESITTYGYKIRSQALVVAT